MVFFFLNLFLATTKRSYTAHSHRNSISLQNNVICTMLIHLQKSIEKIQEDVKLKHLLLIKNSFKQTIIRYKGSHCLSDVRANHI